MLYRGMVVSILCIGCGMNHDSTPFATDGTHYIQAIEAASIPEQIEQCREIASPTLQGECLLYTAGDAARLGEPAEYLCESITHPGWQQACFFEISDAAGLVGDEAITACKKAPDLQDRCLSHAIVRHAGRVADRFQLGEESQFIDWIHEQADLYGLKDYQRVVSDVVAQHISSRACSDDTDGVCPPFSTSACGEVSADLCQQAYRITARSAARKQSLGPLCASPITRVRIQNANLPAWQPDYARPAIEVWEQICRSLAGVTPPPSPELLEQP